MDTITMKIYNEVKVTHIYKEVNFCTVALIKFGVSSEDVKIFEEDVLDFIGT